MTADVSLDKSPLVVRYHIRWLIVLILICFAAVSVGSAYSERISRLIPETLPFPSTYNKKASGYSALYELSQKSGLAVKRWETSYRNLAGRKGTLVFILPWEQPESGDLDNILNWVAEGNDLVYLDSFTFRSGQRILHRLKLSSVARPGQTDIVALLDANLRERQYAEHLVVDAEAGLRGGAPIVSAPGGAALMTIVYHGKGRCLIGSVPELCANKLIADPEYKTNFQFMINWFTASKQPVLFDEKCHGFSSAPNVFFYVLRSPVGFILLQLILIAVIAVVSSNQRFGAARKLDQSRKMSNLEFIDGLASTYRRARARSTAWSMIFGSFRTRLCRALGVAPEASVDELSVRWSEQFGVDAGRAREFLLHAHSALDNRELSGEQFAELVRTGDELAGQCPQLAGNSAWGA